MSKKLFFKLGLLSLVLTTCQLFSNSNTEYPDFIDFTYEIDTIDIDLGFAITDVFYKSNGSFTVYGRFSSNSSVYHLIHWDVTKGYYFENLVAPNSVGILVTENTISDYSIKDSVEFILSLSHLSLKQNNTFKYFRLNPNPRSEFLFFRKFEVISLSQAYIYGDKGALYFFSNEKLNPIKVNSKYNLLTSTTYKDTTLIYGYDEDYTEQVNYKFFDGKVADSIKSNISLGANYPIVIREFASFKNGFVSAGYNGLFSNPINESPINKLEDELFGVKHNSKGLYLIEAPRTPLLQLWNGLDFSDLNIPLINENYLETTDFISNECVVVLTTPEIARQLIIRGGKP